MNRYSIIQPNFDTKRCIVCNKPNSQIHEVVFGSSHRELSIRDGLCVRLCVEHHTGTHGVHNNRELDLQLKILAQKKYIEKRSLNEWMLNYRKDYEVVYENYKKASNNT